MELKGKIGRKQRKKQGENQEKKKIPKKYKRNKPDFEKNRGRHWNIRRIEC